MSYQPPCTLTPLMLTQVAEIVALLTRWSVAGEAALSPQLPQWQALYQWHINR